MPSERRARGGGWIPAIAIVALVVVGVGGPLAWNAARHLRLRPEGRATTPAPASTPAPAVGSEPDRRTAAAIQDALDRCPLLSRATAEALATDALRRGLVPDRLPEASLLAAGRGFGQMEADRLRELGHLFQRVYAGMPGAQRAAAESLHARMTSGDPLEPADATRMVDLLSGAARRLSPEEAARLQGLFGSLVTTSLERQEQSESNTREALLHPVDVPTPEPVSETEAPASASESPSSPTSPPIALGTARSAATAPAPTRPPGAFNRGAEAEWRGRAERTRSAIAAAEKSVAAAEQQFATTSASEASSSRGNCDLTGVHMTTEELKKYRCKLTTQADVNAARATLDRAREALVRARKAWDDLEEQARRQNALPGWLR